MPVRSSEQPTHQFWVELESRIDKLRATRKTSHTAQIIRLNALEWLRLEALRLGKQREQTLSSVDQAQQQHALFSLKKCLGQISSMPDTSFEPAAISALPPYAKANLALLLYDAGEPVVQLPNYSLFTLQVDLAAPIDDLVKRFRVLLRRRQLRERPSTSRAKGGGRIRSLCRMAEALRMFVEVVSPLPATEHSVHGMTLEEIGRRAVSFDKLSDKYADTAKGIKTYESRGEELLRLANEMIDAASSGPNNWWAHFPPR